MQTSLVKYFSARVAHTVTWLKPHKKHLAWKLDEKKTHFRVVFTLFNQLIIYRKKLEINTFFPRNECAEFVTSTKYQINTLLFYFYWSNEKYEVFSLVFINM